MKDTLISICSSLGVLTAASLGYKYSTPTNQGGDSNGSGSTNNLKAHVIYALSAIFTIFCLPTHIAQYIFTELTVSFIGALYPVYRATRAVCTPEENDDKEWLQYWMLGGVLFMITTFVDDMIQVQSVDTVWLGTLTFLFYWLYFPKTCGALVVYEKFTAPVIGPKLKPLQRQMNNYIIYMQQLLSNAVHLYLVWIIFMFLPAGLKRIVAIAIGTVYPAVCSIVAVSTDEIEGKNYLTYIIV